MLYELNLQYSLTLDVLTLLAVLLNSLYFYVLYRTTSVKEARDVKIFNYSAQVIPYIIYLLILIIQVFILLTTLCFSFALKPVIYFKQGYAYGEGFLTFIGFDTHIIFVSQVTVVDT